MNAAVRHHYSNSRLADLCQVEFCEPTCGDVVVLLHHRAALVDSLEDCMTLTFR